MDLRNTNILITGGSRGLGAALATELGARGARLLLVARGENELRATAAAVAARGGTAHALAADVADKDAVFEIAGTAAALLGEVDVVIHAAGALGPAPLRLLADTACEDLQRALEVNAVGQFRLTKALVGPMLLRGRGLIVHVTSDASVAAYPLWGAYGASKAAADHLQRIWAAELEGTGVRFLSIDPGEMDTAMHAAAMPEADRSRLLQPADVARTIAAMLGDARLPNGTRIEAAAWRAER